MASAAEASAELIGGGPRPFREHHPADAYFFPALVIIIWLLMLFGFVPEIIARSAKHARPYPAIIHVHAVVFFGCLVFLASQVALVRSHNVRGHMRLGLVGIGLALAITIVGPSAALTMHMSHQAKQPPQFLAVQLLNIAAFVGLIVAGFAFRRRAAAHKRLMVIGTLALIGAGFGRIVRLVTGAPAPYSIIPGVYAAGDVLILAIGAYDLLTRGRLHHSYLPAATASLAVQLTAGYLLQSPTWIAYTHRLVS